MLRRCAGECDYEQTCFRGFREKRYERGAILRSTATTSAHDTLRDGPKTRG